ncbi:MAG: hypothetical protein KME35_24225 [Aphanocapsa sp. GSE-SYN-MK-11-07L]|jgi:hypothetical protein|nr:hypothetical protein [Aphanocapsa sp. GSE-SYN-MK-11-07L]
MNAYKIETILSEDGALVLKDLPFHVGDAVEVIILERSRSVSERESPSVSQKDLPSQAHKAVADQPEQNLYPLRGKVLYYENPFEPAVPIEDWEVLK